jgi:hypothetical protein
MTNATRIGCENTQIGGAHLYERLERAIIALEYALADARRPNGPSPDEQISSLVRSQEALQSAGEEVQQVMLALRKAALGEAAERVRRWS